MSPDELYDLTLREYVRKLEGFNELIFDRYKTQMEAARLTAAIVLKMFSEKKFTVQEVFPFSWEQQEFEFTEMSAEELDKYTKAWNLK